MFERITSGFAVHIGFFHAIRVYTICVCMVHMICKESSKFVKWVALTRAGVVCEWKCLSAFTTDSAGKLNVFWHNGDSLGMNSTQVCILKETNQVSFWCFLESHNSWRLKSKISLEVLSNFSNQSLERKFSDQEFSWFLISSNFSQGPDTLVDFWYLRISLKTKQTTQPVSILK